MLHNSPQQSDVEDNEDEEEEKQTKQPTETSTQQAESVSKQKGRIARKRRARTFSTIDSPSQNNVFEKQEVPNAPEDKPSLLSSIFLDKEHLPGYLPLIVYLPGKERCRIFIHKSSTVRQVIQLSIIENQDYLTSHNYSLNPKKYELRNSDFDNEGEPDEDLSAYDNGVFISEILDEDDVSNMTPYCLCLKKKKKKDKNGNDISNNNNENEEKKEEIDDNQQEQQEENINNHDGESDDEPEEEEKLMLEVILPTKKTQIPIISSTTVLQVLQQLVIGKLIGNVNDMEATVTNEDRNRLGLALNILNNDFLLMSSGITKIAVREKVFEDDPVVYKPQPHCETGDDDFGDPTKRRVPFEEFLYNDLTAGDYEEWIVIKTNRRMKKQKRKLGIDNMVVHNKPAKKKILRLRPVKIQMRKISDIREFGYIGDSAVQFQILFNSPDKADGIAHIVYEVQTPREAANILAKLTYIIKHKLYT